MTFIKLLYILLVVQLAKGDRVVRTEDGPVRGKTVASGKVEAFLGIPYAEPPVGNLRFDKPVPKASWTEVYEATQLPPPCIQLDLGVEIYIPDLTNMSEDCLYLNMWVPRSKSTDGLKTVMLYIHGGSFMFGSSSMKIYDGAKLSAHGDVIVATINYRIGGLGFFTAFTEDTPGSQALYDQVMAIQWIKDNAEHFGGDPDSIVLFGESAGAFSISMHQVSPLSKNLFKRAILQSGSAVNPLYSEENDMVHKLSQAYADLLQCTKDGMTLDSNPQEVVDCLRKVPAAKFNQTDMEVFVELSNTLYPRVGNDFLRTNTIDLFQKGHFKDSEVMLGITKDEGTVLVSAVLSNLFGAYFGGDDVHKIFNETTALYAMKWLMGNANPIEEDEIFQTYLRHVKKETGYTYLQAVAEVAGDTLITCGKIFQTEYQSMRGNPVYFYMFDHRTSASPFPKWMGVPHFDEVQYVFGNPMFGHFTEYEEELSRDIMDMWVTFAKRGNPNIPGGMTWPRYTYEDPKYFIIGKRDSVGTRPDNYRCDRWRNRYRSIIDYAMNQ